MGSTLTNGIYLPAEGERNCYTGLAANWSALDSLIGGYNAHIGNTTIHVTAEDKEAWNGKADNSALTAHTGDTTIHVTAADKQAWNGKADASALTAHTGDTTIHVTAEDKEAWNGKADTSALNAHTGDTTIHVTAEDKAKWDAVTSKADDSDVVHKSGNETINGNKTFSIINGVEPSSLSLPKLSNSIDISSYITNLTGAPNVYSPPANGYIVLRSTTANVLGIVENTTGMGSYSRGTNQTLAVNLPVVKNSSISIYAICSSLTHAKFIPCQGNV